jgi:guanine deaminase
MTAATHAYRASLLYFSDDPAFSEEACHWHEDGLLLVAEGRITAAGDYAKLAGKLAPDTPLIDYRGKLITPGFIDTHIHYPQTDLIATSAPGLLPWLENHTFPLERQFGDKGKARETACFFLDELLRCGTTTAMVYCSVHAESVEAFFEESHARNLRMIAGKVLMDCNCPEYLRDTADNGARDSEQLIKRWHGRGRQSYAITPRFAATSSPAQLQLAGELAHAHPDVFVQTHVAENRDEVAWIKELYPQSRSYLDVYDGFGLVRKRSMFAHSIWLGDEDWLRIAQSRSGVAHCPTSNLFLGSGLFNIGHADTVRARVSLATDVGGGTSFSLLRTMNEAHKVARMTGNHLSGMRLFYLATLGGARSLHLEGSIGSLAAGNEADFIVLDPQCTPLLARRSAHCDSLEERLFVLAMLGDDRAVAATYAAGRCAWEKGA